MRARYYDSGGARFISEDSAWQGGNWFTYASNDPVNRADFNGHEAEELYKIVDEMNKQGKLFNVFWECFKDKSTNMARRIHLEITKKNYTVEEIEGEVEAAQDKFLSDLGEKLGESGPELEADFEFGEDIVLEFEVIEIDESGV